MIVNSFSVNKKVHKKALEDIFSRTSQLIKPYPYLFGKKTIFGIMPDWNPAEIIGIRPKPLALSLYKDLLQVVTDHSIYLEEYARTMIAQEELHTMELQKMLRDYQ